MLRRREKVHSRFSLSRARKAKPRLMCRLSLRTARGETWRGQSRERQTDRVARETDPRHRRSPLRFGPHPPRDYRSLVADVGVKGTVETQERERDERIPSGCRWAVSPQHAPPLGSAPNSACRVSPVCGTHLEVPLNVITVSFFISPLLASSLSVAPMSD